MLPKPSWLTQVRAQIQTRTRFRSYQLPSCTAWLMPTPSPAQLSPARGGHCNASPESAEPRRRMGEILQLLAPSANSPRTPTRICYPGRSEYRRCSPFAAGVVRDERRMTLDATRLLDPIGWR